MIGKSIFVWGINYPYWTAEKIAAELAANGYESAILHDTSVWNWKKPARDRLVQLLHAAGLRVYGCAAVYGNDAVAEGRIAAELCETYKLHGFIFDAESSWDAKPTPDSNAVKLLRKFREGTQAQSGWCWWARWKSPTTGAEWHPKKVLWAAMEPGYGDCDFGVPMAYWWDSAKENAVLLAEQTFKQWREITDKPICIAGRAYDGDGGTATPEACTAFDKRCRELGAQGITWWAMQYAVKIPGVYEAISAVPRFGDEHEPTPEPTPEPTLEEKVNILWKEYEDKQ